MHPRGLDQYFYIYVSESIKKTQISDLFFFAKNQISLQNMKKPICIFGTVLSHNGSAVLHKDGRECVAIEKERLSRIKHDGGNDTLAIQYCLIFHARF